MRLLQPRAAGGGIQAGEPLRSLARRPTLWVEIGVALAWAALVAASVGARAAGGSSGGPDWTSGSSVWVCPLGGTAHGLAGSAAAGAAPGAAALAAGLPMWALMAAAMMLPTAIPAVRHVAVHSLYWRRRRATLEFVAVYTGLWALFSAFVLGLLIPLAPASPALVLPVALAIAALWQLTPLKRRALRACHRPRALPPRGWRATAGVARFGLGNGAACLASCWAMMLTMAAAGSARLIWMAGLTALISVEKLNLKPMRAARRVGAALALAAVAATALAALGQPALI